MRKKIFLVAMLIILVVSCTGCGRKVSEVVVDQSYNENIKKVSNQLEEINGKLDSQGDITLLQEQNAMLQNEVDHLKKQIDGTEDINYQKYVDIKFPVDGNIYVCTDEDATFYSDEYCSVKITTPQFCSPEVDQGYAINGITIYMLRTTYNEIVYTTYDPSLCNKEDI